MTLAGLNVEGLKTDEQGRLDMDRTMTLLRPAEGLLDMAVSRAGTTTRRLTVRAHATAIVWRTRPQRSPGNGVRIGMLLPQPVDKLKYGR
jgi:hypothetical protein